MTNDAADKVGDILRRRGVKAVENPSKETTVLLLGPKGAIAIEAAPDTGPLRGNAQRHSN